MNKINLKIVTPEKLVYENIVDEIYASTHSGVIGILPEHFPLVTALKPGEIRVKEKGTEVPMAVSGGILEVRPMQKSEDGFVTEVIILADRLASERTDSILLLTSTRFLPVPEMATVSRRVTCFPARGSS